MTKIINLKGRIPCQIVIVIKHQQKSIMTEIKMKRAYEASDPSDGFRVYIDRLWPRGLSRDEFYYNLWDKDISPSTELREWFHADPENRWNQFEEKYMAELKSSPAMAALAKLIFTKPVVTLLYSSRDEQQNNAVVVYNYLKQLES